MSTTGLKIAALIFVLLTMVLAGFGFSMSRSLADRTKQAESRAALAEREKATPKTLVVVATKPLSAFKTISRDNLTIVPVAIAPDNFFANIEEVANRTPQLDIDAGAPITRRYFQEANVIGRAIPAGHQALALKVDEVIGVGGLVRPGDHVDVLLYLRAGAGIEVAQARTLLVNTRVLAFEDRLLESQESALDDGSRSGGASKRQKTVVLSIPSSDVTRVMLGSSLGEVRLALRPPEDENVTDGLNLEAPPEELKKSIVTAAELAALPKPVEAAKVAAPVPPPPPPPIIVEVFKGSDVQKVVQ